MPNPKAAARVRRMLDLQTRHDRCRQFCRRTALRGRRGTSRGRQTPISPWLQRCETGRIGNVGVANGSTCPEPRIKQLLMVIDNKKLSNCGVAPAPYVTYLSTLAMEQSPVGRNQGWPAQWLIFDVPRPTPLPPGSTPSPFQVALRAPQLMTSWLLPPAAAQKCGGAQGCAVGCQGKRRPD